MLVLAMILRWIRICRDGLDNSLRALSTLATSALDSRGSPTSVPFLGHALDLGKQPMEFLMACAQKTTEVFGILAGGQRIFIIHDPLSAHLVLKTTKSLSIAEFQDSVLRDMFNTPEQIVNSHFVDWNMTRKGYGHYLLSGKSLDALCERMMKKFQAMYHLQLSSLVLPSSPGSEKISVKLYDFVARFIFHVAVGTLFNGTINDTPEKCDALFDAFHEFDCSVPFCLAGIPISFQRKAFASLNHIVKAIDPLKEDLSEFVQQRSSYFAGVAEKDPIFLGKNGILNSPIFWASTSNSMPAVFWLMYFLMKSAASSSKGNQNYFEMIRQEIREKIPNWQQFLAKNFSAEGKDTDDDQPTASSFLSNDQLNELYFIDACFTETLRLVSGSFILRIVMEEQFQLSLHSGHSYRFRKGDRVGLFPGLFHKNPKIFPDPEEFDPYRWIRGDTPEEKLLAAQGRIPLFYEGHELNP